MVEIINEDARYASPDVRNASSRRYFQEIKKKTIGPVYAVGFVGPKKYSLQESVKRYAERAGIAYVTPKLSNIIIEASVKKEKSIKPLVWYTVTVRIVKTSGTRGGMVVLDSVKREGQCSLSKNRRLRLPCEGFVQVLFEHALYSLGDTVNKDNYET